MTDALRRAIADPGSVHAASRPLTPDDVPVYSQAALDRAVAAERARVYAELGNDHFVIFAGDRWTVGHSAECRLSGHMHECDYHAAVARIATWHDPGRDGRWRIDAVDSEGLPSLVRADLPGDPPAAQGETP